MNFLKEWITNIVTFVMFLALMEILVPSGKIKKFVSLVGGILLITVIVLPVTGILGREIDFEGMMFKNSNFIDRMEIEDKSRLLGDREMREITEVYRNRLARQAEQAAEKMDEVRSARADVLINEDVESEFFGEVRRVYLYLDIYDGQIAENGHQPIKIEKIRVEGREINENLASRDNKSLQPELEEKLKDKISTILNVSKEDIVISLNN